MVGGFTQQAMAALLAYPFPGNVRELANMVERAVTLTGAGPIGAVVLPERSMTRGPQGFAKLGGDLELPADGVDLEALVGDLERRLLLAALRRTRGVRKEAAKLLRISFRSMRYRLDKYDIDDDTIGRNGGV